jgi:hypothetical protein
MMGVGDISKKPLELFELGLIPSALGEHGDLFPDLFRGDGIAESLVLCRDVLPVFFLWQLKV